MMEDKATFLEMELSDGTKIQMSLTFGRLFKLRQRKPEIYEKYNNLAMNGMKDELEFIDYLYAAYLCANIEDMEGCMGYEEFLDKIPANHMEVLVMANRLKMGGMKKNRVPGCLPKEKTKKKGKDTEI